MNDSPEFAELVRLATDASASIERAVRTLRALGPVLAEIRGLQSKIEELQTVAAQFSGGEAMTSGTAAATAVAAPAAPTPPSPPPTAPTPAAPTASASPPAAAPEATKPAVTAPKSPSGETATGPRTISVTLVRTDGPLDLVPVHNVLSGLPGISRLAVASYTRDRAVILLDTDKPSSELALERALGSVFPDGIKGEWQGETDYLVTVGNEKMASAT